MPASHIDSRFCQCGACRAAAAPRSADAGPSSDSVLLAKVPSQDCRPSGPACPRDRDQCAPPRDETAHGKDGRDTRQQHGQGRCAEKLPVPRELLADEEELDEAMEDLEVALRALTAETRRSRVRPLSFGPNPLDCTAPASLD